MHTEMGIKCQGGWIAVSRKQWVALSTKAPCLLMSSRHQTKAKMVLEMREGHNCKLAPRRLKSNTNSHFQLSRSCVFLEPLISKMSELSIYWFQTKLPTPTQRRNYPQTFYKTTHAHPPTHYKIQYKKNTMQNNVQWRQNYPRPLSILCHKQHFPLGRSSKGIENCWK